MKQNKFSKVSSRSSATNMILGMVLGFACGIAIGIAMDLLPVGIAIGTALGVSIGTALDKDNRDLDQQLLQTNKPLLISLIAGLFILALLAVAVLALVIL